ncbi:uncharacterized protein TrAFT101_006490 [Trichoderma asperellum]|uniref:uncharacterized protein n=1 Tax=Trichoderma asperellum TaxID=101201 RepID=UPI00332B7C45|nr:hypothetical protein TrAFT101_006490 [Trichoderma asperellum]
MGNRDIELAVRLRDPDWSKTCQNHFAHEVALPHVPETVSSLVSSQSVYLTSEGRDEVAIVQVAFGDNAVDIQQLLVKMTSNSTRSSAMALRQTLLALSFQFFFVPSKAIQHQNQAIQHLQTSIDRTLPWDKDEALQAIAASMLLSVYEILTSWGCSLELLDILYEIFDNVFDRDSEQHKSPEHNIRLKALEQRLHHLIQCEHSDISNVGQVSSYNTQIAEFYRLAALLYLQRVARNSPRDAPHVIKLAADAYRALEVMARCDRPWPLFVIALEASTEDERRLVLVTIETLLERRPLRKWMTLRTMIQQAWSQIDLAKANSLDALLLYQSVINHQRVPPMFI